MSQASRMSQSLVVSRRSSCSIAIVALGICCPQLKTPDDKPGPCNSLGNCKNVYDDDDDETPALDKYCSNSA